MPPLRKKKIRGAKSGVWALPPKPEALAAPVSIIERRAYVRHFCEIGALVDSWPAQIANISQGGVKIVIPRRFEEGTILKVEVPLGRQGDYTMLLARVVRINPEPDGSWALGCAFTQLLSEEELQQLLAEK
jgi:PilZ domain